MSSSNERNQNTHFISLPLAIHPELVNKLVQFQSTILGNPDQCQVAELGIDNSIFANPKTFHLTVKMLALWNDERFNAATEVLQNVLPKVIQVLENRPLFVRLTGLVCLNGTEDKARILYAPIEEIGNEGRLLRACQAIIDAFDAADLVLERDKGRELLLHATVMNSYFRSKQNSQFIEGRKILQPFDARGILEQFGSEEWGEYHIREVHLSKRFSFDENGYYHCCASMPFP